MTNLEIIYTITCAIIWTAIGIQSIYQSKTRSEVENSVLTLLCGITVLPAMMLTTAILMFLVVITILEGPTWLVMKFKNFK